MSDSSPMAFSSGQKRFLGQFLHVNTEMGIQAKIQLLFPAELPTKQIIQMGILSRQVEKNID